MKLNKHFLFLLCLLTPLFVQGQQYELMRVAKIDIIPENLSPEISFNPSSVRARMHTKVGSLFSQGEFDSDLKMLADEYARIEPSIEVINDEIHIKIQIWFKPTIRAIDVCGNERIKTKKILKELEIEPGSLFERDPFIQALNKIRLLYVKKGYFEAEVDYSLVSVEGSNEVDVQINVREGRAGRVKKICFNGLTSEEEKNSWS